jgi:hypothetical protein
VVCAWSIPVLLFNPWAPYLSTRLPTQSPNSAGTQPAPESIQSSLEAITSQLVFVTPTASPQPGVSYDSGIYIVGDEIQPGLYRGQFGDVPEDGCYWARLRDLTEATDSIIAAGTSQGQFYIEVKATDLALQVFCTIISIDPNLPQVSAFPQRITPSMYLVGAEVLPGQYRGQIRDQPCSWQRLSGVDGEPGSVIASGTETEDFTLDVLPSDFALATSCILDQIE